jgi:hypothetical protein
MLPFPARAALCAAAALALASCDSLLGLDGDPRLCRRRPPSEALADELVIVRVVETYGDGQRLYLDRVRYLAAGDSSYLNRVVIGSTHKVRAAVEALHVQRGDTLRVTTTFDTLVRAGGYEAYVPRWPANDGECWDGAWVALHAVESVAAATR